MPAFRRLRRQTWGLIGIGYRRTVMLDPIVSVELATHVRTLGTTLQFNGWIPQLITSDRRA